MVSFSSDFATFIWSLISLSIFLIFVKSFYYKGEPFVARLESYAMANTPIDIKDYDKQCDSKTLKRNGLKNDHDFVPIVPKRY